MNLDRRQFSILATALAVGLAVSGTVGGEIDPAQMHEIARGERAGTFSARTIVAAVEIDRDAMRLVAYTVKDRPFVRPLEIPAARALKQGHSVQGHSVQAEVILHGPDDRRFTYGCEETVSS